MTESKKTIKCPKCFAIAMEYYADKEPSKVICKECGYKFQHFNSIFKAPTNKTDRVTSSGKRFS